MVYSGGMGLGGIWLIILLVIVIALLVLIAVRLFTGPAQHWDRRMPPPTTPPMPGHPPGMPLDTPPAALNRARDILDERLARGEITPEQYRELRRAIEEQ